MINGNVRGLVFSMPSLDFPWEHVKMLLVVMKEESIINYALEASLISGREEFETAEPHPRCVMMMMMPV